MPGREVIVPLNALPAPRDTFARPMRDLRISVMDRCNFRCPYCMPRETYHEQYRFLDRKSTRLNSSHLVISYAVFCLKKKKTDTQTAMRLYVAHGRDLLLSLPLLIDLYVESSV